MDRPACLTPPHPLPQHPTQALRRKDRLQVHFSACLRALKDTVNAHLPPEGPDDVAAINTILQLLPPDLPEAVQLLQEACTDRLVTLFGDACAVFVTPSLRARFCALSPPAVELWSKSCGVETDSGTTIQLLMDHYHR